MNWQVISSDTPLSLGQWYVSRPLPTGRFFKVRHKTSNVSLRGQILQAELIDGQLRTFDERLLRFKGTEEIFEFVPPACFSQRCIAIQAYNTERLKEGFWQCVIDLEVYADIPINLEGVPVQITGLSPEAIGADPAGSAAAAITEAQRLISLLSAADIGADPAGSAAAAQANAIAATMQLINSLTAAQIKADPVGSAESVRATLANQITSVQQALTAFQTQKAKANGLASLGADGILVSGQRPPVEWPNTHLHLWGQGRVEGNKTFTIAQSSTFYFGRIASLNSPALDDEIHFALPLASGNYRLEYQGEQAANRGIISFYLNGIWLINSDWFNSVTGRNTRNLTFNVPSSGIHDFMGKVTGKNAASTGFEIKLSTLSFFPTYT